jgi:hypothetical protein
MTPELSRRDAIAALGAAGVATAGLGALTWEALDEDGEDGSDESETTETERREPSPTERETLVAAAEALYPSEVSGVETFVETYVVGRLRDRQDHEAGVREAARAIDDYARQWYDGPYAELDRGTRQDIFDEWGLDITDPVPDGSRRERVRYYLVNELLYAFYSSPTGGELVGIENPQGHPGGTDSYQRGP